MPPKRGGAAFYLSVKFEAKIIYELNAGDHCVGRRKLFCFSHRIIMKSHVLHILLVVFFFERQFACDNLARQMENFLNPLDLSSVSI